MGCAVTQMCDGGRGTLMRWFTFALVASLAAVCAQAFQAPRQSSASAKTQFVYDDLENFARAQREIAGGAAPVEAFQRYIDAATPGFRNYVVRYEVTAQKMADEVARRPLYYAALPALRAQLARWEREIAGAAARLQRLSPMTESTPFFFLIANQTAGGTPVVLAPPGAGPTQSGIPTDVAAMETLPIGIALAIDMLAIRRDIQMSEFPNGVGGRASLEDLPQVAIHELVHVHQRRATGSLQDFLSIYRPPNGTMLANAVREGCAEYFTYLVSGRRLPRHAYGMANEMALWTAFRAVMDRPNFSVPGWYGGRNPDHPDWPSQIGYWVGMRICEAYYQSRGRSREAVQELFSAHRPEQVQRIVAVYAAQMERRAARR
jgi:hypothetical protein